MSPQMACLRGSIITLVAFVWLISTVCFQMSPQIACLRRCIVTLVAFVWLFSNVCFRNEPSNCIFEKMPVTPVAIIVFVSTLCIVTPWLLLFFLFSTVYFQMTPQITCLTRCIVALVAFFFFFFYCCFQLSPQFACLRICLVTAIPIAKQSHWQHLFDAFFICVFSNESSNHLLKI